MFFKILTTDQQTNFTPDSKRLIGAKIKKQWNLWYKKGRRGMRLV